MTIPTVQTALFWWVVPEALLAAQYQQSQEAQPLSPWWAPPDSHTGPAPPPPPVFPSAVAPWCVWSEVKPKFKPECRAGFSGALQPTDWLSRLQVRWQSACNAGGEFKCWRSQSGSSAVNCSGVISGWSNQVLVSPVCYHRVWMVEHNWTDFKQSSQQLEGSRLASTSCTEGVKLQSAAPL